MASFADTLTEWRKFRIFKLTMVDFIGTFFIAIAIHALLWSYPLDMKNKDKRTITQYIISLLFIFVMLLGLGTIFHRIFGVKSALSGYLGFNDMPV